MWQRLATFILAEDWLLTPPVESRQFRVGHNFSNPNKYQVVALLALAGISETGKVELFKPQRIQPRAELEILQFPAPPSGWRYSLAAKQILLPNQSLLHWHLEVDMPLYPVNPPDALNPNKSSSFTPSTANVTNAASKILSANNARKSSTYYNSSNIQTVYLDVASGVTSATAAIAIPPGNIYVDDVGWIGDVYAVTRTGTATLNIREFT